jgi:hypothetical protein
MSLPKQCLYTNKINTSYARNFQSAIAPQNGAEYNLGETIILNIPTGANLVGSGQDSILKFNVNFRSGAANTTYKLNRSGAYSIIQRMRIFLGSTLLSDIDSYGNLMDLLMTTQQSTDSIAGKYSIMAGTTINPVNDTLAAGTDEVLQFAIPFVSIFSWSQNYIPLFAMSGPLRIELQLLSNIRQFIHSSSALVDHSTAPKLITGVELVMNMMEISDSGMNIIKSAIGNSPVQWVVQDYKNSQSGGTLRTTVTQLSIPIPAKYNSLNSLFWTFRHAGNTAGLATFPSNESLTFNLKEYFVRLGPRTVPTKPPNSLPEFCTELLRALGSPSDVNHECNLSAVSYSKVLPDIADIVGAFYLGLDLESYSNTDMTSVYSGYNSSTEDIIFNPTFNGQANNVDIRIDTYALYDCLISLENGVATAFY